MYGYGAWLPGFNDLLTGKAGGLQWGYDSNETYVYATYDECYPFGAWNGWEVDACYEAFVTEDPASHNGIGEFHWDPFYFPPSYYHTLFDQEIGYSDGKGECYLGYSGDIVTGVTPFCDDWE